MSEIYNKLLGLMEKYFGDLGETLLKKNLDALSITDIDTTVEAERTALIDELISECFSTIMSLAKMKMVKSKLISILSLRSSAFARNIGTEFDNARM